MQITAADFALVLVLGAFAIGFIVLGGAYLFIAGPHSVDTAVFLVAVLATFVSYMDEIVNAPVFWVHVAALLAILSFAVVAMVIVWVGERRANLPGSHE